MKRTVSPKLAGYVALVAGGLLAALALRRPGLVGLAAPLALWLAVGLVTAREPELELAATADRDRAVEGEEVEVAVRVAATTRVERVELWLRLHPNLEPTGGGATCGCYVWRRERRRWCGSGYGVAAGAPTDWGRSTSAATTASACWPSTRHWWRRCR
jgi:hypothetical protein